MLNDSSLKEFENFANNLADKSAEIIMKYFRDKFEIQNKSDDTPVTIADKNCEELIRRLIKDEYPSHGIIGEEYEKENVKSEFVWVIDPIDGTRSFIAGHKDFGTLISLTHNNKPILGIINCPAHKERWVGKLNEHSKLNGNIINTSKKQKLQDGYIFTSGLYFDDLNFKSNCNKLLKKAKYYRFGGDCYMYGMLASGLIDVVIEDTLKVWDYMALIPVIEGAGGTVTDINNNPINFNSDGTFIATANKTLHQEVIRILKSN